MNLGSFLISQEASIKEALASIDNNTHGVIFIINSKNSVIGIATDGDIRRRLVDDADLDSSIGVCANKNFYWADETVTRESLIKKLDEKIVRPIFLD